MFDDQQLLRFRKFQKRFVNQQAQLAPFFPLGILRE